MPPQPSKRICLLSDGTWNSPESSIPTNIFTLSTTLSLFDSNGTPQLVFYDQGVGTHGNIDYIKGGVFADGIDLNIQQLYTALSMNYSPGDEVYLFGFSRGAYTVRSLAGLINKCGLVRRDQLDWVKEAYEMYRDRKISSDSEAAVNFRKLHGDVISIKCLACFDTVGSLGIPVTYPFPLRLFSNAERYRFHDTTISDKIEHAIHLMSIDEDREAFRPTPMKVHPNRSKSQLTQVYFPGGHAGVGGGAGGEKVLSDNALCFMVEEMKRRGLKLAFEEDRLPEMKSANIEPVAVGGNDLFGKLINMIGQFVRDIPSLDDVHDSAVERYKMVSKWRPLAMKKFEQVLLGESQ